MTWCQRGMIPAALMAMAAMSGAGAAYGQSANPPRIVLLGTGGGPGGRVDRAGIATMLEVDGKRYLIDAGSGVSRQLAHAGVAERDVPLVFLTHLHDDHYAGLTALASFAYSTRGKGLTLIGPSGVADLAQAVAGVMAINSHIRTAEGGQLPSPAHFLSARPLAAGETFSDGTVTVRAVANSHYTLIDRSKAPEAQSLSYRFDFGGKSVVFTGDTGPSEAVVALAKGADILICEMATAADRAAVPPPVQKHMDVEHLTPAQAGDLARQAGVRHLVLSHVGQVSESDLTQVRAHFSGTVTLGRDLDIIQP
ncbi:MBL fold metallo-hydrolase [Novosphingobium umbonatum]|nr:MBL fold metallo-hydrolase [Novosphingobium umbonatum]